MKWFSRRREPEEQGGADLDLHQSDDEIIDTLKELEKNGLSADFRIMPGGRVIYFVYDGTEPVDPEHAKAILRDITGK